MGAAATLRDRRSIRLAGIARWGVGAMFGLLVAVSYGVIFGPGVGVIFGAVLGLSVGLDRTVCPGVRRARF